MELSPGGSFSKGVFVYENPTPAGESRNSKFAAEIPSDSYTSIVTIKDKTMTQVSSVNSDMP